MEDQAKFLTWCTYKFGVRPSTPKCGGPDPPCPLKLRLLIGEGQKKGREEKEGKRRGGEGRRG